jgi:hypothetical protein
MPLSIRNKILYGTESISFDGGYSISASTSINPYLDDPSLTKFIDLMKTKRLMAGYKKNIGTAGYESLVVALEFSIKETFVKAKNAIVKAVKFVGSKLDGLFEVVFRRFIPRFKAKVDKIKSAIDSADADTLKQLVTTVAISPTLKNGFVGDVVKKALGYYSQVKLEPSLAYAEKIKGTLDTFAQLKESTEDQFLNKLGYSNLSAFVDKSSQIVEAIAQGKSAIQKKRTEIKGLEAKVAGAQKEETVEEVKAKIAQLSSIEKTFSDLLKTVCQGLSKAADTILSALGSSAPETKEEEASGGDENFDGESEEEVEI